MKFRGRFAFLSNFYNHPIEYDGVSFATSEHAYQAMKADNEEDFEKIRSASTPGKAKRLAKSIKLRKDWNKVKLKIMREIQEEKFSDPTLLQRLLEIEGPIIEDNEWNDTYWGMCNGKGYNHLGKILMRIRSEAQFFS